MSRVNFKDHFDVTGQFQGLFVIKKELMGHIYMSHQHLTEFLT